jgi:hypothetical protein
MAIINPETNQLREFISKPALGIRHSRSYYSAELPWNP